jgi:OOP family OmpA-OmpF porin
MKYTIIFAAACAAALSGCASQAARDSLTIQDRSVARGGFGTPQDEAAGAAVKAWTDAYTPIKRRGERLDALQARLDRLASKKDGYDGAKAQCWIDTGKEAFTAHDEWGFVEEAIGEASALIGALEAGTALTPEQRTLRTTVRIRPDLWAQLRALRTDSRFASCSPAQKRVACAEVELTYAEHQTWTRAFVDAQHRVDAVQGQTEQAGVALAACAAAATPPSSAQTSRLPEMISLSADALFEFDRGDVAAIGAEGRQRLDDIAVRLQRANTVERVVVAGYTDRLGDAGYNLRLSQQRAETVKRYLAGKGVTVRIAARGYGKAPRGTGCSLRERDALIACLAPDRRVEIRVFDSRLPALER